MSTVDFTGAVWRRSTRSTAATNANCVEVAHLTATVGVRDSKNPTAPPLTFRTPRWRTFLHTLRS